MGGDISLLHQHALKTRTGKRLPSFCSNRLCAHSSSSRLHPSHKVLSTSQRATVPHPRKDSAQGDDLRLEHSITSVSRSKQIPLEYRTRNNVVTAV
jgi:hypothetical protein